MGKDRGAGGDKSNNRDTSRVNSPEAAIPVGLGRRNLSQLFPVLEIISFSSFFPFFFLIV